MKLTIVLLLFFTFQTSAKSNAQLVTIVRNHVRLSDLLKDVEHQTGLLFFYDKDLIENAAPLNVKLEKVPVRQALSLFLKQERLTYTMVKNTIVIQPMEEFRKNPGVIPEDPPIEIHGRVVDQNGKPLQNVSILISGTHVGTTTGNDGRFSITAPDNKNIVLEISSIGYQSTTVKIGKQTDINVVLQQDIAGLSDVIVIGYGTQKRKDLTGAIASVNPSEIQQTPITSVDQGLVGRASGVVVTQTSGMPGAIASIRIRGSSSLQGGNEPLYVIDGVPVYSGSGFGNTGGNAQISPLSTINPDDIESIEILKDASATAIYGSRAANGVVLITTKTGKRGRDIISFDSYYGTQSVVKKIKLMDATNYAKLVNEAYTNDGLAAPYSSDFIAKIPNGGKGTDWQDQIFRTAPIQNYGLSFSGGDAKSTYDVSLNYMDQTGIVIGSDMKRYSGRINLNRKIGKRFNFSTHLSFTRLLANTIQTDAGGTNGVVTGALMFNPILPVYQDPLTHTYTSINSPGILIPNPVATALDIKRKNNTTRLLGDFAGEYEIIDGLKLKVLFGIDYFMNKAGSFTPSYVYQSNGVASASISDAMYTNWLNENTLTYSKTFNTDHSINLLGGVTFQGNQEQDLSGSSQGFVNNVLQDNSLGSGSIYNQPTSSLTDWSLMSFLGRANYSYKSRYLFTVSGRYDGSSRFGANNKFAFFPSAAIAWRASEEDFIKKLNLFSNLKIRTGYGVTGNQEIGLYNSLATLGSVNYSFNGNLVTGFSPNIVPNPDLKWERTAQYDAGLDIGFFDNDISLTADYYYKKTTNLIYSVSIPLVSGFGTSLQNIGSVENKGLELSLQTNNINKEFKWNTSFNISFNQNKVLQLGGEQYKDVGSGDGHLKTGSIHRLIVGKPIGVFYGYVLDGIFQTQAEVTAGPKGPTNYVGGKRYKDISGPNGKPDGKVDATYDRTIIGDPNPKFYGGLANTFNYKGFELNVFINYSYGNDIFNYNAIQLGLPSGGQNVYADLINRWTPDNPSNTYGKATTNRSAIVSNQFIEDGSFIKLKTVALSYLFPKLNTRYISSLKVYVSAQNLLTITGYKGYDPEVSYRGASNLEMGEDFGGYPQSRTILFGIRLNLK